jgi:membrane protease YdiL (CAAX protease family)
MTKLSNLKLYYIIAFAITWVCWITALVLLKINNLELYSQEGIVKVFTVGFKSPLHIFLISLFGFGTYGPAIAAYVVKRLRPGSEKINFAFDLSKPKIILFIIVFPLLMSLIPNLLAGNGLQLTFDPIWFVPLLVYQFFTSGFEEFGWRGYALPELLKKQQPGDAGWNLGLVWAAWHFPLVIYLYMSANPALVMLSLLGFTMNIAGVSIIYAWIYTHTKSITVAMLFHALQNTFSFFLMAAISSNPTLGLLPAAVIWLSVVILMKKFNFK